MKNLKAQYLNKRLAVKIYNENILDDLVVNKFTKKQIRDLFIDDLIEEESGLSTKRLRDFTRDMLKDYKDNV